MEIFPGDSFTEQQIRDLVRELINAELLTEYEAEGKMWLIVTGWRHQKIDRPNYRYPHPNSTNARRTLDEQSPPEVSKEVDRELDRESELDLSSSPEGELVENAENPASPPSDPSEYTFPCKGKAGISWTLPRSKLDEYRECYPDLDVDREMRRARQWCRDNPVKRKTPTNQGMLKFLTSWLNREQNNPRRTNGQPSKEQRKLDALDKAIKRTEQEIRDAQSSDASGEGLRGLPGG